MKFFNKINKNRDHKLLIWRNYQNKKINKYQFYTKKLISLSYNQINHNNKTNKYKISKNNKITGNQNQKNQKFKGKKKFKK